MRWADALLKLNAIEGAGGAAEVMAVEYDSRRVRPGAAFVAMRGGTTDGNRFIDVAIANGAPAVVTDSEEAYGRLRAGYPRLGTALVKHGRRALAELSAAVLGHPERELAVSAVTGTNGKTTVTYLLEQMLRSVHRQTAVIGTIETRVGDTVCESPHTTPESSDTFRIFADSVGAGVTEVVMEMSSHALEQERVWGIPVDVAIFTNLTQDHLDYHGTMEKYAAAKARLFQGVGAPPPRVAVINMDDATGSLMREHFAGQQLITYSIDQSDAFYRAFGVRHNQRGTTFSFDTPSDRAVVHSPLHGRVNVSNLLAAMCAALARGIELQDIVAAVERLRPAPGRFEVVPGSADLGITVVVDYAHTDDALRNLISIARQVSSGRVITLFGCGGDRDRTKRPKMGRAAAEGSDLVVLTSDNPRSEDPMRIIEEALTGVRSTTTECVVEPDRAAAIELAIAAARPGDIVLIAGKGHEKVQVVGDRSLPFDDVQVAAGVLKRLAAARG